MNRGEDTRKNRFPSPEMRDNQHFFNPPFLGEFYLLIAFGVDWEPGDTRFSRRFKLVETSASSYCCDDGFNELIFYFFSFFI
jgi:hypothetical protein